MILASQVVPDRGAPTTRMREARASGEIPAGGGQADRSRTDCVMAARIAFAPFPRHGQTTHNGSRKRAAIHRATRQDLRTRMQSATEPWPLIPF